MLRSLISLVLLFSILLIAAPVCAALDEVDPAPAELIADDSWVMVVIPDTQGYTCDSENMPILETMMDWIVSSKDELNIQLVVQVGDLVYQNSIPVGAIGSGDQHSQQQWENAQRAFFKLNDLLPYILVTGNHDYGISDSQDRGTQFENYFTPKDNPLVDPDQGGILAGMGTNSFGIKTLENACYDFTAPDGRRFLIIGLEWGPRSTAVNWARWFAGQRKYDDFTKILVTHAYLYHDDTRLDWATYGVNQNANPHLYHGIKSDTYDGEELWKGLVRLLPNFEMVLCGHIGGDMVGYLASTNNHGCTVHQMLFNAQFLPNGGNGWLRLLEFKSDGKTVVVHTFSPWFAREEFAGTSCWRMEPQDEFSFELTPLEKK